VKADLADACLGQHRQENSMVEVVRIENRALGSLEDKLVGDVVLALKVSFQQTFVSKLDEYPAEFAGQIHSPGFLALRSCVFAPHIVVLHQDEAVRINVIST
jgi:hypothetical protein